MCVGVCVCGCVGGCLGGCVCLFCALLLICPQHPTPPLAPQQVMPFSTACSTPLSNFEAGLNYKDVSDPAVMVGHAGV